eukprot:TRINITY_DN1389_c0_g2_i1.p1 TRINITY_DN1389_c0_g2~~TRINITY_DN1389_c0_g2_i1.p1  ORF type:complete len:244 (+),score=58.26 TRINITY_DN1389_c0_g2_i1:30-734(+)
MVVRAVEEEAAVGSAASATNDSVVSEVAVLPEQPSTKKPGPLSKGGTLSGAEAEGKDPGAAALGVRTPLRYGYGDKFEDPRWRNGTWDIVQFTSNGKTDWDAVIDAEVLRRKWLEDNPEASSNDEPVVFETSVVPWWAWVKRFHLPEAELLNGRAAMVGYAAAFVVDSLTGVGLVDQQSSFLGKLLLLITIGGVLFIRRNDDVSKLKNLAQEWTFYDNQWQATWKDEKAKAEKK